MKVKVTVKGEDDINPFTKVFDYDKSSEFIFDNMIKIIKEKISKNLKLNINETLALLTSYILESTANSNTPKKIQEDVSQLLLANQVLIGVPELLIKLTFSIVTDKNEKIVVIESPIQPEVQGLVS